MNCQICKHCIEIANGAYVCDLHQKRIALNGENKRGWISESCADFINQKEKNNETKKVWVQGRGVPCTSKNLLFALLFCFALGLIEIFCHFLVLNYYWN